ncbi:hypothetical protein QVD17_30460 [Tagetes erecta]|uniref:Uncharacterized protein n=1 Tax=Tagetes erecta TaxID=13708 RepID=A0AAD8K1K4_TARER|nr:hypothetical protein QVD17_30460 [Tagetes erecta]
MASADGCFGDSRAGFGYDDGHRGFDERVFGQSFGPSQSSGQGILGPGPTQAFGSYTQPMVSGSFPTTGPNSSGSNVSVGFGPQHFAQWADSHWTASPPHAW